MSVENNKNNSDNINNNNIEPVTGPCFMNSLLRTALAIILIAAGFASSVGASAQTPQFRASSTLSGSGTLNFPAASVATDLLVMSVTDNAAVATPAGWTPRAAYTWNAYGYRSYVFTRVKGSATSVTIATNTGGAILLAYQGADNIGAIGTFAESAQGAGSLSLTSITPQNSQSVVLGIVTDRDGAYPTPPSGFTSRVNLNMTAFGNNVSEKAFGSSAPTGTRTWGQYAYYPAVGVLIEVMPPLTAPGISNAFSPAAMAVNGVSTLTITLTNPNGMALGNVNFTDTLTNLSVAGTTLGGTCAGTTNSPALMVGATALNLTIPSVPAGGCTVTVPITGSTVGSQTNATSGATSTQTPVAGPPSNTATLTVTANPAPPTLVQHFAPAWIEPGGTSTLTVAIASPSAVTLTNVNFTDVLTNMTIAGTALGGTCVGTTNTPALTVGATGLNLTIPAVPYQGCTVTVQVTSATAGSNANVPSGATSTESLTTGVAPATAYLTVNAHGDVGFYYVHADHLGTPRAITRPSDNAKVWEWKNDEPFGANLPNENPSGLGTLTYNLRHPGQYADVETGTFYNYFRDYDPSTGRYIQSDPIGLEGGINTYAYVGGDPLTRIDPYGENWKKTAAEVCFSLIELLTGDDAKPAGRDINKETKKTEQTTKTTDDKGAAAPPPPKPKPPAPPPPKPIKSQTGSVDPTLLSRGLVVPLILFTPGNAGQCKRQCECGEICPENR